MKRTESNTSAQALKKTQPEEFDLVILGGGTGSTIAAWTFAGEGKQVAVVERKYIDGSCPNIACLPSNNIIHSAKVASYFRRSEEFGIIHDRFAIDMAGGRERKRRMVRGLNDMYMENYRNTGRVHIGNGPIPSSENSRSHPGRWDNTSTAWRECDREYGHACRAGSNSRPGGSAAAHAYRGS
jgi:hypothetical protein